MNRHELLEKLREFTDEFNELEEELSVKDEIIDISAQIDNIRQHLIDINSEINAIKNVINGMEGEDKLDLREKIIYQIRTLVEDKIKISFQEPEWLFLLEPSNWTPNVIDINEKLKNIEELLKKNKRGK